MESLQQKQKYLRQTLQADWYEDFGEFFINQIGDETCNLQNLSYAQVKNLVDKFKSQKQQQEKQQRHQRSFANYQTADLQQAYTILTVVQNSSNSQPQKKGQKSATDLLDSVFEGSSNHSNSPDKNSPPHQYNQNNSPPVQNNVQSRYRSSTQISAFEKGNIWATTSNVQSQRKSAEFDNFWQFPTTQNNKKTQEFKTQSPQVNNTQSFQFNNANKQATNQSNQTNKVQQPIPSYEQLTKNLNMSKKPNSFVTGQVEKPSNMKKPETSPAILQTNAQNSTGVNQYSSNAPNRQPSQMGTNSKQIKLISQKPLNPPQQMMGTSSNMNSNNFQQGGKNFSTTNAVKMPKSNPVSAYKMNKIPYKGPTVHKNQFQDIIPCIQAHQRPNLSDPRLEVIIEKHQVVEKNFFRSDYVMYFLTLKPLGLVCKRNYEDFTKLKQVLEKFYPGVQLPYLQKNPWFQTNAENIKKQKTMLQFFTNDLIQNPQIRNSRIFEDFLTLKQHKAMKRKFEEYSKMDSYKSLDQLCVLGGKVQIVINEKQRIYHECLGKFIESVQDLLGKKNKLIQILGNQFVQVNQTLVNLGKLSAQISQQVKKFNMQVSDDEIPSLQNTFSIISKSFQQWASRISFESKVVNKRLVPFYKYQTENLNTLKSVLDTENSLCRSYLRRSANEPASTGQSYASSSLKTYKTGILQQSKNLTVLKYQLGFMSNMVCKQSARFFQLMSQNFKAKWIYQAQKYNQRLSKDMQFYTSISAMAR